MSRRFYANPEKHPAAQGLRQTRSGEKKGVIPLNPVDKILCKGCRWDGHVTQCEQDEITIVKNLTILLCPMCDYPLARKMGSQITLTEQNAVIMERF